MARHDTLKCHSFLMLQNYHFMIKGKTELSKNEVTAICSVSSMLTISNVTAAQGEQNLKNIFLSGQVMYFGVKVRDFEGFLILTRKPPGQLNFSKFYKILDRGSRGGPNPFFILGWAQWSNSDHFSPKHLFCSLQIAFFSFGQN